MVSRGLVDNPRVSQYRLTAHLGIALLITGMLWIALKSAFPRASPVSGRLRRFAFALAALIFAMALGGLVAGSGRGSPTTASRSLNGRVWFRRRFLAEPWYRNFSATWRPCSSITG